MKTSWWENIEPSPYVRGSGNTTKQMLEAPKNAVFVWTNANLNYPKNLARDLKRKDLKIVAPYWLDYMWCGLELTGIVLDHAANLTKYQFENYKYICWRINDVVR